MSRPAEQFITPADYLALERQAETKSEYLNGFFIASVNGPGLSAAQPPVD